MAFAVVLLASLFYLTVDSQPMIRIVSWNDSCNGTLIQEQRKSDYCPWAMDESCASIHDAYLGNPLKFCGLDDSMSPNWSQEWDNLSYVECKSSLTTATRYRINSCISTMSRNFKIYCQEQKVWLEYFQDANC